MPEDRVVLPHLTKRGLSRLFFEPYRNRANIQFQLDLFSAGVAAQRKRRAQRGMSGKRQFFLYGENAHSNAAFFFGGGVTRQNVSRLGKIHLFRNGLHFVIAEAAAIRKDRQRITLKGL